MLARSATGDTAAHEATPKILEMLAHILTSVVGLTFALYLAVGVMCMLLACLWRMAGRAHHSTGEVPVVEETNLGRTGSAG
jgi:hypothetical protein